MARMSKEERRARRKARKALRETGVQRAGVTVSQIYVNNEDWYTVTVEGYKGSININKGGKRNPKWSVIGQGPEHINVYDKRQAVAKSAEIIVKGGGLTNE